MRIAVTGGPGQLVLSMLERGALAGHDVIAVGPPELDLAAPADETVFAALGAVRPDAIVNAAAYTAVDKAESERDLAFAINATGAGAVARAARRLGVPLVHISTDFVFSGDKIGAYIESDPTGPNGVYGASKLAGEQMVLASGADAVILRTAWLFSPFGANFIKTMLRLAETRDELDVPREIRVVADQYGSPTSALDLADAALAVLRNLLADDDPALRGLFHCAGGVGAIEPSWADLAEVALNTSATMGGPAARVRRIPTADYPTPAKRPANSLLDCERLRDVHGIALPDWRQSAAQITSRLVAENGADR